MDSNQYNGMCLDGYPSPFHFPSEFTGLAYPPFCHHVDLDENDLIQFDSHYKDLEFLNYMPFESCFSQSGSAESTTLLSARHRPFTNSVNIVEGYDSNQVEISWPSQYSTDNHMISEENEQRDTLVGCVNVGICAKEEVDLNIVGNALIASSILVSDGICILKEKMIQALHIIKQSTSEGVLLQIWTPMRRDENLILSTYEQPFVLDAGIHNFVKYRNVSVDFSFSTNENHIGNLGLPGRVFLKKLPEWTPNVQYYSREEYLRRSHAINCDIRGSLAVPVFESGHQTHCLGVLELIMISNKIKFSDDLCKVSKALEAVDLKTSIPDCTPNMKICNRSYLDATAEIHRLLKAVCGKYNLPLAQTWFPCGQSGAASHLGYISDKISKFQDHHRSKQVCLLTRNKPSYLPDARLQEFRKACIEHSLTLGEGIVGQAYVSRRPTHHQNVSLLTKSEYPLVHYARMFDLIGSVAIPVRYMKTVADVCVLEFFLSPQCKEYQQQEFLFKSIIGSVREFQHTSPLISMELFMTEKPEISSTSSNEKHLIREMDCECQSSSKNERLGKHRKEIMKDESMQAQSTINRSEEMLGTNSNICSSSSTKFKPEGSLKPQLERKLRKAEKTISIDVLKKYFAGSLKDASRSLGVCPTTLKRICRQQGIARWPSRKINKINNSLWKLQEVIESVKCVQAPSTLTARTSSFSLSVGETPSSSPNTDLFITQPSKSVLEFSNLALTENTAGADLLTSKFPLGNDSMNCAATEATSRNLWPMESTWKGNGKGGSASSVLKEPEDCREDTQVPPPYQNMKVKLVYKEDVIRLQIPLGSGLSGLLKEVAKRLKVDSGSTHIKYLDSDSRWVTLACDADLYECIQKTKATFGNLIRLTVEEASASSSNCS